MATKSTHPTGSEPDLSALAGNVSSEAITLPEQATQPQEKELPILTIGAADDFA